MNSEDELRARLHRLEEENRQLRKDNRLELYQDLAMAIKAHFNLQPMPCRMLAVMLTQDRVRDGQIELALYGDKEPNDNTMGPFAYQIRRALKPHGIEFRRLHNLGYEMTKEHRERVLEMIGELVPA